MDRIKIKSLLEKKKMTIYRLSKLAEVSEGNLRTFMNGSRNSLTIETVAKIAKALGVQIEELLIDELKNKRYST